MSESALMKLLTMAQKQVANLEHKVSMLEHEIQSKEEVRPDLKEDDPLIVWSFIDSRHNRYFKEWSKDGKVICFIDGQTKFSTNGESEIWDHYERPWIEWDVTGEPPRGYDVEVEFRSGGKGILHSANEYDETYRDFSSDIMRYRIVGE